MGLRANVVIEYEDDATGQPKEWWLYHHYDGNVQGAGEEVVQAVHSSQVYVASVGLLKFLLRGFPRTFENADGMQPYIEFLYRVRYASDKVTVVARHGDYAGEDAEWHYRRVNDTTDNSVELYSARFEGDLVKHVASVQHDIREPESYVRDLLPDYQSAARCWRGRLR